MKEEKFSDEEFAEKAIQLHKLYCELYDGDDLIGIGTTSVHVKPERYFSLTSIEQSEKSLSGENIRYSSVLEGVPFITLVPLKMEMLK